MKLGLGSTWFHFFFFPGCSCDARSLPFLKGWCVTPSVGLKLWGSTSVLPLRPKFSRLPGIHGGGIVSFLSSWGIVGRSSYLAILFVEAYQQSIFCSEGLAMWRICTWHPTLPNGVGKGQMYKPKKLDLVGWFGSVLPRRRPLPPNVVIDPLH